MKIYDCIQGTDEWLQLRAGIPTASCFDRIVTPSGEPSKSAEPYMFELLAERLMGHPIEERVTLWMARGSEMEIDAVQWYEFQTDMQTVPVGFITNDAGTIGVSPDRLVGERGLFEAKVPSEGVHVSYLLSSGGAYKTYKVQVQGQLWIAGKDWTDVVSYHPELPKALIRIERDEKFIAKMDEHVSAFSEKLEKKYLEVMEHEWARTPRERTESELEASIRVLKQSLVNR